MLMLTTPEQIDYAKLATVKAAMKLERVGMKTRHGALRPKWAETLGLKPRDSYDTFIAELQRRMDEYLKAAGAL